MTTTHVYKNIYRSSLGTFPRYIQVAYSCALAYNYGWAKIIEENKEKFLSIPYQNELDLIDKLSTMVKWYDPPLGAEYSSCNYDSVGTTAYKDFDLE
jgi:hypothetical protein